MTVVVNVKTYRNEGDSEPLSDQMVIAPTLGEAVALVMPDPAQGAFLTLDVLAKHPGGRQVSGSWPT